MNQINGKIHGDGRGDPPASTIRPSSPTVGHRREREPRRIVIAGERKRNTGAVWMALALLAGTAFLFFALGYLLALAVTS